jgi:hypothetical protein
MNRRDLLKTLTLSLLGLAGLNPQVTAAEMLVPSGCPAKSARRPAKV